ncbi:aminotransferase class IV [Pelagicoccus enzymogenes]|uniref:aminotransferase class IV n=1 Tax=Pelagicoccus enzymogenes TaxID=2773457 RepID=UPI00280DFDEA|nr:aminotransferase class IV [Pelagicoccus enzymogenes]MDQ8199205.1 aminotransferase class IV [Pelagicoccus enzymogenes]
MAKLILNGELLDADALSQPLLSRGFAFGFGVFETMKFLDKTPCFFSEHLGRLRRGLVGAGLDCELDETALREQARLLFEAEGVDAGVFKIVITDSGKNPSLALFVRTRGVPTELAPSRLSQSKVVKASQAFTSRNKSLNYMESVLELEKAKASGFDECVFKNERNELTECAVSNLFFVQDGVLSTPALDCGLLDGIVRRKVIELARQNGIEVKEGVFEEADLLAASEVFLTSSGSGPRSVASYQASSGMEASYEVKWLPRLRESYLELEREEARSHRV